MNDFIQKTFLLFLTVTAVTSNTAQQVPVNFENLNNNSGISHPLVNCIAQDQTGYLWIGTHDGLNYFDGYEFKILKNNPSDTSTISNNNIQDIYVDGENNIWIGTHGGGLNKFDKSTQTFSRYIYKGNSIHDVPHNIITKIIPYSKNIFYLGTENEGLIKFEIKSGRMERLFKSQRFLPENNITSALQISSDKLLLGTDDGLFLFDIQKGVRRKILNNNKSQKRITSLCKAIDGSILVGTYSGLMFKLSLNSEALYNSKLLNPIKDLGVPITFISRDYHGSLLVGTESNLSIFDENNLKPKNNSYYFQNTSGTVKLRTKSIFIDKFNILWVGTFNQGLFKFSQNYKKFINLNFSKNPYESNYSVCSILKEQNGVIWVGTDGNGLLKYNIRNNRFMNGGKSNFNIRLNGKSISSILKDRRDNYWFATFGDGIYFMDQKGRFKHYYHHLNNAQSISSNHAWKVFEDKVGNIWCCTKGGLDCINYPSGKILHYINEENNPTSLSNNNVLTIFEDKDGILWIGTYGGLNKFNRTTCRFTRYTHSGNDSTSISDNTVMSISEDKNNNLWLGCEIGLNKFDKKSGTFIRYYEKDGLPNNEIYAAIPDAAGNIWISTNKGISYFNPRENIFRNYDLRDGLQCNEFNEGAYFHSDNGEIFFGGIKGITYFNPGNISINKNLPKVIIKNIKVLNKELPFNQFINETQKVYLSYNENYIQIEFAGLEFTNPAKNLYSYKLDGLDNNWINSGTRRVTIYTNLSPGNYIFRVQASNNDVEWSKNEASLMIYIFPPFWMKWWFRAVIAVIIISILYGIHKMKIKRVVEIEKLRFQIASDLHDEVGAMLTSLSIQVQLLRTGMDKVRLGAKIKLIEELSRKVIGMMSDVVWSIDSRNDTVQQMINQMKDFSSQIFNEKNMEINYSIYVSNPEKKISIDNRHNIYLIFKEAINNVVRHSNSDNVEIKISSVPSKFEMAIIDNGIGLDFNENKNGNGLKNMSMRADKIGGKLNIISNGGLTIKFEIDKL